MKKISSESIVADASHQIFGNRLVVNVFRSVLVEAMVATALPDWKWCSTDYSGYDFRKDLLKLEVKQSARAQSWFKGTSSRLAWDISAKTGYWEKGDKWVAAPGRIADLYILAMHDVTGNSADHRCPDQWQFFVVPEKSLPHQKTIGLSAVLQLATAVPFTDLSKAVDSAISKMPAPMTGAGGKPKRADGLVAGIRE